LLLESIASGELYMHLRAIAGAIDARLHLLHTMESIDALAELVAGDHVRIDRHARPRYLQGLHGTVVDVDAQTVTISLQRPVGRFTSGELRCPPLVLDRLGFGDRAPVRVSLSRLVSRGQRTTSDR
jgi:RNase P/RNase MRP subunit p29